MNTFYCFTDGIGGFLDKDTTHLDYICGLMRGKVRLIRPEEIYNWRCVMEFMNMRNFPFHKINSNFVGSPWMKYKCYGLIDELEEGNEPLPLKKLCIYSIRCSLPTDMEIYKHFANVRSLVLPAYVSCQTRLLPLPKHMQEMIFDTMKKTIEWE